MNRTLHEADNAQRILKLTADTMLLVDRNGICIDIDIHSNLWFLQEERLLGKNIFERMPEHTREKVYSTFQTVLREQRSISKNYKLELEDNLKAHVLQPDGTFEKPARRGKAPVGSQAALCALAVKAAEEARKKNGSETPFERHGQKEGRKRSETPL